MYNPIRHNFYENIEKYLPIPYQLDEPINFSERNKTNRYGIVTKDSSVKVKQLVSTPRGVRRLMKPLPVSREATQYQVPEKLQQDPVEKTKSEMRINPKSLNGETVIHTTLPKSKLDPETSEIVKQSVKPVALKRINSVSTDTVDMDIENYLKYKNLEKENIILEQQKDLAEAKTLVFYLSEQLMLSKYNENNEKMNAMRSKSEQYQPGQQKSHPEEYHRRHEEENLRIHQEPTTPAPPAPTPKTEEPSPLPRPPPQQQQEQHQQTHHRRQMPLPNSTSNQKLESEYMNLKTFSDKYTETSEPLSLNTMASVINTEDIHGPLNPDAVLVTLDNTWLVSWSKPESVASDQTTVTSIVGYVISINGMEIKRIPSAHVTKSIIHLSEHVRYPVTLHIQSLDENNYLSKPALITLNA
uniref:RIMS-binding protein 1/2/3 Fn3 domain-containing protein n=1 Tax=Trichobilharzia regenti TaxID=157069 RepID=A0AA85KCQ0_TRIRE|nr:unnamed protein product [Trichobilharzia regenti]